MHAMPLANSIRNRQEATAGKPACLLLPGNRLAGKAGKPGKQNQQDGIMASAARASNRLAGRIIKMQDQEAALQEALAWQQASSQARQEARQASQEGNGKQAAACRLASKAASKQAECWLAYKQAWQAIDQNLITLAVHYKQQAAEYQQEAIQAAFLAYCRIPGKAASQVIVASLYSQEGSK